MKKDLYVFVVIFLISLSQFQEVFAASAKPDSSDTYYFVSNRSALEGKFTMFKARTNQSGISSCLIKGNFEVKGFPHMRKAEVSVYNISNDELVGIYNTNPRTGNYLIILAPNIKYEFVINSYGYAPQKKIVEIPSFASTAVDGSVSTQKILLNVNENQIELSLNSWIVEEKEPTLFLLTVYDESKEETHNVQLYNPVNEKWKERDRRMLSETEFDNIDDLIKKQVEEEKKKPEIAEKAFLKKDYNTAIALYGQLLKLDDLEPLYNYRMGVSLYHTDKNKLKSIKYLEKASNTPSIPNDVFYYIGKTYHLWSIFGKAEAAFLRFKAKATEKEIEALNINRLIENNNNGKKMMQSQLNMIVVERSVVDVSKLPKGYPSELVDEKILKKTSFFTSPYDGKKKEKLLMFKTQQNEMIQTSYGLNGENGKDLFVNYLIGGDKWGLSKSLGENINTKQDEDYVYVTLDGKTMYFSSKGHNSIGGYDIFISKRNKSTDPWGKPENMGYPINSPYDDILFIPDFIGEFAYFSSNRRNPNGGFNLYKINMPKPPLPLTVIKGHFMTTSDSVPEFSASIAVYNTNNQEIVGIYNTNAKNGNYLMALMPGIKYEFALQCDGFNQHTAYVTVPVQTESFALRQNIRLKKESSFEILKVDNYFTQEEIENVPEYKVVPKNNAKKEVVHSNAKLPTNMSGLQLPDANQQKIINAAKQFFINKQYLKSASEYAKIAATVQMSTEHCFYYGKSLFNVTKEYETALTFLEKSAANKSTPYEVYYMLGKTNHYNYRFERAVKAYEMYKVMATEKEVEKKNIASEINLSKFGQKIINNPKPIEVISKKEFEIKDMFRIYSSADISGKFLLAPEDMTSTKDKKRGFHPMMYLNDKKTLIYYTSYGEGDHKDIYLLKKLPNNTWSAPLSLGANINTEGDEDYPYLTADGQTLYFSSTKHGSMGGYDVFKAEWNSKKETWGKPVNMGAPINSPFDDMFYVE